MIDILERLHHWHALACLLADTLVWPVPGKCGAANLREQIEAHLKWSHPTTSSEGRTAWDSTTSHPFETVLRRGTKFLFSYYSLWDLITLEVVCRTSWCAVQQAKVMRRKDLLGPLLDLVRIHIQQMVGLAEQRRYEAETSGRIIEMFDGPPSIVLRPL